jgi:hypothetical protein
MSLALRSYNAAKINYDGLTGANQPQQQQSGQLSVAQRNFLSRRAALGDDLTGKRMRDYATAHVRATNAGLQVDSPEYFSAIEKYCDTMTGDGRQPLLNEREAARVCGISDSEYALAYLKATGQHD